MSLDVETPPPPAIDTGVDVTEYEDVDVSSEEYRREELEEYLEAGAWERAFGEWSEHTDVDEVDFAIAESLGLFEEFDFFWDGFAERVGYHAPGIPEDWQERDLHPELDSWGTVSNINAGLTELGQVVCDVLQDQYIDWESEFEAPDDLPDF
jgi:hypothetical protein